MLFSGAICLFLVGAACLTTSVDARPSEDKHAPYPLRHEIYRRRYHHRNTQNCDHCLPGWGLVEMCNKTHPTVCKPCDDHFWSPHRPHLNRCLPCSKCGEGLYEEHKCSPDRDTRCNSCRNNNGVFTEDFILKCSGVDLPSDRSDFIIKAEEEEMRNEQNVGVPDDGDLKHEFWAFNKRFGPLDVTGEKRIEMKPSYHEYEFNRSTRQRLYILIGFAAVLMLIAVVSLAWIVRECRRPTYRVIPGRQKLYAHLTDLDHEIIRQCASKLTKDGKLKTYRNLPPDSEDDYWEETMHVTENPMEHFIAFSGKERLLPKAKC